MTISCIELFQNNGNIMHLNNGLTSLSGPYNAADECECSAIQCVHLILFFEMTSSGSDYDIIPLNYEYGCYVDYNNNKGVYEFPQEERFPTEWEPTECGWQCWADINDLPTCPTTPPTGKYFHFVWERYCYSQCPYYTPNPVPAANTEQDYWEGTQWYPTYFYCNDTPPTNELSYMTYNEDYSGDNSIPEGMRKVVELFSGVVQVDKDDLSEPNVTLINPHILWFVRYGGQGFHNLVIDNPLPGGASSYNCGHYNDINYNLYAVMYTRHYYNQYQQCDIPWNNPCLL